MRKTNALAINSAAMLCAALLPSAVAQEPPAEVQGEVIAVEQHVRTQNGGEFDRIRIRTRQGEELRLRLGQGGSCEDCVAVGDQVRARLMKGGAVEGEHVVRRMINQRTGDSFTFRNRAGDLVQNRSQARKGDGSGQGAGARARDRVRDPANGCTGSGSGSRGGAGRGGRGSGGGGGRR